MSKLLIVILITLSCYSINTTLHCATIPWDPSSSYNIPNDSNTYTLDSRLTLSSDLSVSGVLELLYSGIIVNPGLTITMDTSSSSIDVKSGAALYNYYGNISMTDPSAIITARQAGRIDNVRGSTIDYITVDPGGNFSDRTEINLEHSLDIDFSWTITNKAIINGGGHAINLGTSGAIIIENNASILFSDLSLNTVSGNKIRCTDNSSTVSLNNVTINLDDNYSFTKGIIYIAGNLDINSNQKIFSYQSDQISTVTSNASLNLIQTIFNYNSNSNDRLYAEDKTSVIQLNNSTISASQALTINNASMLVSGLGTLQGDATIDLTNINNINIAGALIRIGTVIL